MNSGAPGFESGRRQNQDSSRAKAEDSSRAKMGKPVNKVATPDVTTKSGKPESAGNRARAAIDANSSAAINDRHKSPADGHAMRADDSPRRNMHSRVPLMEHVLGIVNAELDKLDSLREIACRRAMVLGKMPAARVAEHMAANF